MGTALSRRNGATQNETTEPRTVPQLLRLLGVQDMAVAKQGEAIIEWLADHTLSPKLWQSLVANGYGLEVEQTMPDFQRPIPYRRITTGSGRI